MNSIDKRELKIISYEFRSLSNRLLNCNSENAVSLFKRFVEYLDQTEIIHDYIHGFIGGQEYSAPGDNEYYKYLGDTLEQEISEGYNYFKHLAGNCKDFRKEVAFKYAPTEREGVKAFCDTIIHPFVSDIVEYLTKIEIKMGYDETAKYSVIVNGDNIQVNIAEQGSNQSNPQTNGVNVETINAIIESIRQSANDTELNQIEESLTTIQTELSKSEPQKPLLRTAVNTLKGIKGSAECMAALATLYQVIGPLL